MNQSSADLQTLEYAESIIYIRDQRIMSYDLSNNKYQIVYYLNSHGGYSNIHQDVYWTRVVSIGLGEVVVTYFNSGEKKDQWASITFVDRINNRVMTDLPTPIWGVFTTQAKTVNDFMSEQLMGLKLGRKNWIPKEQISKISFDKPVIFKKFSLYVEIIIDGVISELHPIGHAYETVMGVAYCKYEKILYVCSKSGKSTMYQKWKMHENKWIPDSSRCYHHNDHQYQTVHKMSCSKKYLFVEITTLLSEHRINFIDKQTCSKIHYISGCHAVGRDDYYEWFAKNLDFLKNVNELEKMCEDVLKIILSYIS